MADPIRETPKAHAAFEAYWALGDGRTCAKVAEGLGKSTTLIEGWCARHHWRARVIARQDQLAAERQRVYEESRAAAIAKHERRLVKLGREGETMAIKALRGQAEQGKLGPYAAVQLLALAAKLALRGYREPESITRQEHTGAGGGPVLSETETHADFDHDRYARLFRQFAGLLGDEPGAARPDGPAQPAHPPRAD